MLGLGLGGYHPDSHDDAAVAFGIQVVEGEHIPVHQHRKGQLSCAARSDYLRGGERDVDGTPQFAGGSPAIPHSNCAAAGGTVFLFIEPGAARMPAHSCTLKISPLCAS